MPSFAQIAAFTAAAAPALVSAHGYVSGVVSGGQWYSGTSPSWIYQAAKPETAGWYANNQDNGFVEPASFGGPDVIWYLITSSRWSNWQRANRLNSHKNATPGLSSIPVAAGSSIDFQW